MSAESKQALVPIMNGQYEQIARLEEEWGIRFREGDLRARIDYFHDAVRALTSGEADIYARDSRLSVEYLAYDIACLREIQVNPVGRMHIAMEKSVSTEVVSTEMGASNKRSGPPRHVKAELKELYKDYTVLFAALFAEVADVNFKARSEDVDSAVEDIGLAEKVLQQLANGDINKEQATILLDQIEQDELREKLQQTIATQTILHAQAEQIMAQLNGAEGQLDAEKEKIDKAHLSYVTSQLAVYEESKETIKRLAAQGMNLAGKFVENALSQSKGTGRGQGF